MEPSSSIWLKVSTVHSQPVCPTAGGCVYCIYTLSGIDYVLPASNRDRLSLLLRGEQKHLNCMVPLLLLCTGSHFHVIRRSPDFSALSRHCTL